LKYSFLAGALVGFFIITPAFAAGLTAADSDYLTTQNVQMDGQLIRGLSPKEQSRLHALINDLKTVNDPTARAKDVAGVLAEFKTHQDWEVKHPGQLWDTPTGRIPN